MTSTPEFVAWCLVHECPLRGRFDLADPLQTDRRLKSLQTAAIALAQRRCVNGWCLEPHADQVAAETLRGFRLDDVLSRYSGAAGVDRHCRNCPASTHQSTPPTSTHADGSQTEQASLAPQDCEATANAASPFEPAAWGSCYGLAPLSPALTRLPLILETLAAKELESQSAQELGSGEGRSTWADLWKQSPMTGWRAEQVATTLAKAFNQLADDAQLAIDLECESTLHEWQRLLRALRKAAHGTPQLSLAVAHFPQATVSGRRWSWPERCRYCLAPKSDRKACSRCGDRSPPLNAVHRGARGDRPYRRLSEVLSLDEIRELQATFNRWE